MLKFLKYTIFIAIGFFVTACIIGAKNKLVNEMQLNEQLSLVFPRDYHGPGLTATEEGNEFIFSNDKKTVKFHFSSDDRNAPMEFDTSELPDSLPKLNQSKRLNHCQIFYTNDNGLTFRNSNATVFYHFEKEGKFKEILLIRYNADKQKQVEKIVKSIVETGAE